MENPKVRSLVLHLPQLFSGQLVPVVALEGIPETVNGYWGLFEITLTSSSNETSQIRHPVKRKGYQCVFVSDKGKLFMPTARFIWDQLLTQEPQILRMLSPEMSVHCFETLYETAATVGQELFNQLKTSHEKAFEREYQRGATAFSSRKKTIYKVGLPEVRNYRLQRLQEDKLQWQRELKNAAQVIPDIRPLLMFSIGEVPGNE